MVNWLKRAASMLVVGLIFCNELMEDRFKMQPNFPCANTEWLIIKLAKMSC